MADNTGVTMKFGEWEKVEGGIWTRQFELPPDIKIHIPAEDGRCLDNTVPIETVWESGFPAWRATCMIIQYSHEFILLSIRDSRSSYPSFRIERMEKGFKVSWTWAMAAYLQPSDNENPPEFLIDSFNSLNKAVENYRNWMNSTWPIERMPSPAWLSETRLLVMLELWTGSGHITHTFDDVVALIKTLVKEGAPPHTIIYFWGWSAPFDTNYPEYWPAQELGGEESMKRAVDAAQKANFHLLSHCNWWGIDSRHPDFIRFKDAQVRSRSGERCGWRSLGEPAIEYIRPIYQPWREFVTDKIAKFVNTFGLEAVFLDQIGAYYDDPQCNFDVGTKQYVADLLAKCPDLLIAGEFYHERYRDLPLWQVWGTPWCGLPVREEMSHSDILGQFFGKDFRMFSHMGMPAYVPVRHCWPAYYWYIDYYGAEEAARRANDFHHLLGAIPSVRVNFREFGLDSFTKTIINQIMFPSEKQNSIM